MHAHACEHALTHPLPVLQVSHAEAGEMLAAVEQQLDEIRAFLKDYTPIEDAGGWLAVGSWRARAQKDLRDQRPWAFLLPCAQRDLRDQPPWAFRCLARLPNLPPPLFYKAPESSPVQPVSRLHAARPHACAPWLGAGVEDTFQASMSLELEALEARFTEARNMQARCAERRPRRRPALLQCKRM